ncbi:hypothetical protein PF006_g22347 [Phytophthora fragariae]|nr:hypothetical protein PF003_g20657 [Phytophthora fragariae]KAE9102729.1 hypothetical protein PF006_g22347 [Phytophthora fragariae]
MKLQEDSTTLLDVRDIFVALVEKHPVVDKYLAADAAIVKDPDFEAACVLALADKTEELTEDQQLMLSPFETVAAATATPSPGGRPQGGPVGEVEPAHGAEEHTLSNHRQGMLQVHLETVLFLKLNRRF